MAVKLSAEFTDTKRQEKERIGTLLSFWPSLHMFAKGLAQVLTSHFWSGEQQLRKLFDSWFGLTPDLFDTRVCVLEKVRTTRFVYI